MEEITDPQIRENFTELRYSGIATLLQAEIFILMRSNRNRAFLCSEILETVRISDSQILRSSKIVAALKFLEKIRLIEILPKGHELRFNKYRYKWEHIEGEEIEI